MLYQEGGVRQGLPGPHALLQNEDADDEKVRNIS